MKTETRYITNYYYSWRRYLRSVLASSVIYYNPVGRPKAPSGTDQWLIFLIGQYIPKLFTRPVSTIHCVCRDDDNGEDMIALVNSVVNILDNPQGNQRDFILYDKATAAAIGTIDIESVTVNPQQEYDTGINSISISIHCRLKTNRKM